jgi:hypothetical protein
MRVMIRTVYFACHLPTSQADALNRASGRIYTRVMVEPGIVVQPHEFHRPQPLPVIQAQIDGNHVQQRAFEQQALPIAPRKSLILFLEYASTS